MTGATYLIPIGGTESELSRKRAALTQIVLDISPGSDELVQGKAQQDQENHEGRDQTDDSWQKRDNVRIMVTSNIA